MKKHLFALLACVFVVMVGFGITLPVLPFSVERLTLAEGASRGSLAIHVGLLTGVYASGPLLGGALFVWHMNAPYLLTAVLLVSIAFVIEWNALVSRAAIGSVTSRFLKTSDNWLQSRSHHP